MCQTEAAVCVQCAWNVAAYGIHATSLVPTDHCMVNFIKRNLLGSLGEFRNRFINPIENGQCADSTPKDVRIMKKRAHVLHAVLAGCVQVTQASHSAAQLGFIFLLFPNTACLSFPEKRLL